MIIYTYAYGVDNTCFIDGLNCNTGIPSAGWLYKNTFQWIITPLASERQFAFDIITAGNITGSVNGNNVRSSGEIRPSVYLSSGIKIIDGDGSEDHPYTIE